MKLGLFSILLVSTFVGHAQTYNYNVDLINIQKDQVEVVCTNFPDLSNDKAVYHFPKVVPGTYAIEDYGKYIASFSAFAKNGNTLEVKKMGNNDFMISNARELSKITYLVNDAMDMQVKKNKIFEPASTNIESGKNVVMNNGGFFGYFDGTENSPITIKISKPEFFFGATSLPQLTATKTEQIFQAKNYHQLVDCPILFSKPDTANFYVNNTLVTIACFDRGGKPRAQFFYNELKKDMEGIAKFLPKLPVDNYTFLVFVDDFAKWGPVVDQQRLPKLGEVIPLIRKFSKLGVGALEHGNSSFYYLADFGDSLKTKDLKLANQMTGAAIHEFMHIVTPLGLHSQHIGNFNYAQPIMCQHLWLYEGVTEYFAHLIKLQAGIYSKEKYLSEMRKKIIGAEKYPKTKMSFTEMSKNVLEKEAHKQYGHVYDRGAVYAWLLDVKIIELTKGKKTLKDVILTLNNRYGKDKSFDEESIIKEIVGEVNPELQLFFDELITGRIDYDLAKQLLPIGIEYLDEKEIIAPRNPISNELNDITIQDKMLTYKIQKVGINEWAGLKKNDRVKKDAYADAFKPEGKFVAEGTTVQYQVKRNKVATLLPIKVKYEKQVSIDYLGEVDKLSTEQKAYWKRFIGE